MTDELLLEHLARDVDAVRGILVAAPDAAVPHCPGWSVADLVRHHGDVHRWAAKIVATGRPVDDEHVGPEGVAELADWYADGAARLIEVLAGADPASPCWTFDQPPGEAWFWTRRQALEATIHRWDAQAAVGTGGGIAPEVAAAGITEVVDDLFPRQVALRRTPSLPAAVSILAADLGRRWTLPGRAADTGEPAEIAGPAEALLLLLWRRVGLGDAALTVTAPPALREELQAARFAP